MTVAMLTALMVALAALCAWWAEDLYAVRPHSRRAWWLGLAAMGFAFVALAGFAALIANHMRP